MGEWRWRRQGCPSPPPTVFSEACGRLDPQNTAMGAAGWIAATGISATSRPRKRTAEESRIDRDQACPAGSSPGDPTDPCFNQLAPATIRFIKETPALDVTAALPQGMASGRLGRRLERNGRRLVPNFWCIISGGGPADDSLRKSSTRRGSEA
jgi:hypothetical protein